MRFAANVIVGVILAFVALIALIVVHPWILAIPDRVGEWRSNHDVHVGMRQSAVLSTLRRIHTPYDFSGNGDIVVSYSHFETICEGFGLEYEMHFDTGGTLRSIRAEQISGYC